MADKMLDNQRNSCEEEINKCVHDSLVTITERMRRIGINQHSDAGEWFKIIKSEVEDIMHLLVTESEYRERVVMAECVDLLKQAEKYCKILRTPMEPHGQDEERCLIEEKILLKKRLEEYETLLQAKRKEIHKLQKRNISVAKSLNEDPIKIDEEIIPTDKEFQNIVDQIEKREKKRYEREEAFLKTKEKTLKLMTEFQITPTSEFQINVTESSVEKFVLSEENMKLLEEFYGSVKMETNSLLEKVAAMRLKVQSMWDLLVEDTQKCDDFIKLYPGSSQITLEAYRNELYRCEEVRKSNIGKFIEKLRSEISDMWDKCHFSYEDRDAFIYFKDSFYSEDLLEIHDRELERLQQLYNDNKNIFLLFEDHEKLWKKVMELEKENTSPSRLFNRGGILLKEEKKRKVVQQKLPKIDAALVELANEYEKLKGKPFRSYGRIMQDIIDEKYIKLEQAKQERANDRKQKRADLTPGKSGSTLNLARSMKFTSDMKSTTQRRILSPKNATTSKKARILAVQKRKKIPILINGIPQASTRSSSKRNRLEKTRRLSDLLNAKGEDAYKEFTVQLCKSNLRSSLLPASPELLAVPLAKTPPNPFRSKSPCETPRNKSAYKLAIASNKKILF